MRSSRRFRPLLRAAFAFSFLALAVPAVYAQSVQASSDQLPSTWIEAVHTLAERIGATFRAHATLVLEMRNLSSLSALEATSIREAFQTESMRRGFRIGAAPSAGTELRLTMSEGIDSYVWVAEWTVKDEAHLAIIGVPKASTTKENPAKDSLRLESKLIWQQPSRILDFALVTSSASVSSTLVTLEPARLAFYSFADSQWQFSDATDIPHSKPWPRDIRGLIDVDGKDVQLPDAQCKGDLENPREVRCVPWKGTALRDGTGIRGPWHDEAERALLGDRCDGRFVILASGNGDWTQPDSIQGYSSADLEGQAKMSGSAIEFDGPVMSLNRDGNRSAARAVVHNLKTGSYEAYIVTATCSH